MNWKEIIKEDMLEKVILALMPMYGSRKEIIDSNILGVQSEGELYLIPPYTKEDVKSLIEDIRFAAKAHGDSDKKNILESIDKLTSLLTNNRN